MLTFTFINLQMRLTEMRSNLAAELAGNPFASLATGLTDTVQLQWGWALLVAGAGAVIAAAVMRPSRVKCDHCAELIQASARIRRPARRSCAHATWRLGHGPSVSVDRCRFSTPSSGSGQIFGVAQDRLLR
jgi:hypothetical protein